MDIFLWVLGASLIGAVLYRLGGAQGYDTKFRDTGLPLMVLIAITACGGLKTPILWLSALPAFGLMWLALTTYRYRLPKPKDYTWVHYGLHGFFCSLAALPISWASGHWIGFGIRVAICTIFMAIWSKTTIDWLEEGGRGFILVATSPLLLI